MCEVVVDVSLRTEADESGSDVIDRRPSMVTTKNHNGGFAGSEMTVVVTGEEVAITEDAHELHST